MILRARKVFGAFEEHEGRTPEPSCSKRDQANRLLPCNAIKKLIKHHLVNEVKKTRSYRRQIKKTLLPCFAQLYRAAILVYLRGTPTWSPENNCTGFQTNEAITQPGCQHIYISRLLHLMENEIVLLDHHATKHYVTTLITAAKETEKETLMAL